MTSSSSIERCATLCETKGWRLALGLMGNRQDAEDVLQQAMLVVTTKADAVPRLNPWPWLAKIIMFEARNARRRRATRAALSLDGEGALHVGGVGSDTGDMKRPPSMQLEDPKSEDPIESMLRAELRTQLWKHYQELPNTHREVLGLVCLSGLSQRAAAKALGIPASSLSLILNEGLERLRVSLGLPSRKALHFALVALPLPGLAGALAWTSLPTGAIAPVATGTILMKKSMIAAVAAVVLVVGSVAGIVWWSGEESSPIDRPQSSIENSSEITGISRQSAGTGGAAHTSNGRTTSKPVDVAPSTSHLPNESTPATDAKPTKIASAPLVSPLPPSVQENPTPVSFTVSGTVSNPSGEPVAAAAIALSATPLYGTATSSDSVLSGPYRAVTGSDGSYAISVTHTMAACFIDVTFTHGSFAEVSRTLRASNLDITLDIQLGWDGVIFGTVVDERTGEPQAKCGVLLEGMDGKDRVTVYDGQTDDNGNFRIEGLEPSMYGLSAVGAELSSRVNLNVQGNPRPLRRASAMIRLKVGEMSNGPNILKLPPFATLRFQLRAPAGGTVFVDLSASTVSMFSYGHWGVPLDPNDGGIYEVDWLRETHRLLELKAEGYALTRVPISPRQGEDLDLGVIELSKGRTVEGRVEDENGRAVVGASLELEVDVELPFQAAPGTRVKQPKGSAISGNDGSFIMTAIAAGSYELFSRHAEQGLVRVKLNVPMDRDPRPLTIVMPRGGVLLGTLPASPHGPSDAVGGGDSLGNMVALIPNDEWRYRNALTVNEGFLRFLAMGAQVTGKVDENGVFELEGVTPGTYGVIGTREGRFTLRTEIEVTPGGKTRVDFDWRDDTGMIEGRVVDEEGMGIANHRVFLSRNPRSRGIGGGSQALETRTDGNGNYRFEGILPGTAVVYANSDAQPMSDELIKARTVKLSPRGRAEMGITVAGRETVIRGLATIDSTITPSAISALSASNPKAARIAGEMLDGGRFSISLPDAGEWIVIMALTEASATGPSFGGVARPRTVSFAVAVSVPAEGLETRVNANSGSLKGRVSGLGGGPLAGARVSVSPAIAKGVVSVLTTTDANGEYTIPMVQGGDVLVTVSHADVVPVSKETTVQLGSELNIELTGQSGTIEIVIASVAGIDPADTKWTYINVSAFQVVSGVVETGTATAAAASARAPWRPGYNGTTKLASLAPGSYRVVFDGAVERMELDVVVEAGKSTRIEPALIKKSD